MSYTQRASTGFFTGLVIAFCLVIGTALGAYLAFGVVSAAMAPAAREAAKQEDEFVKFENEKNKAEAELHKAVLRFRSNLAPGEKAYLYDGVAERDVPEYYRVKEAIYRKHGLDEQADMIRTEGEDRLFHMKQHER